MGSRSNLPIEIDAHFVLDGLFDFGLGCAVPVLVQPLRKVGGAHAYRTGELRLRPARLGDGRTHRPAELRAAHPSDRFGRVRHCQGGGRGLLSLDPLCLDPLCLPITSDDRLVHGMERERFLGRNQGGACGVRRVAEPSEVDGVTRAPHGSLVVAPRR